MGRWPGRETNDQGKSVKDMIMALLLFSRWKEGGKGLNCVLSQVEGWLDLQPLSRCSSFQVPHLSLV